MVLYIRFYVERPSLTHLDLVNGRRLKDFNLLSFSSPEFMVESQAVTHTYNPIQYKYPYIQTIPFDHITQIAPHTAISSTSSYPSPIRHLTRAFRADVAPGANRAVGTGLRMPSQALNVPLGLKNQNVSWALAVIGL